MGQRVKFPVWTILAEVGSVLLAGVKKWRVVKAADSDGGATVTAGECEEMGAWVGSEVGRLTCEALKTANKVTQDSVDLS